MAKSYDAESIKTRMKSNLSKKTSWAEVLPESTNARLIDVIGEELAEISRLPEYLLRESKHTLARNRSSIVAQTKPLGYFPHRKIGATGYLKLGISEDIFNDIYYPTISYNEDDIIFYHDVMYQSLQDDNIGNTPATSPIYWTEINRYPTVAIPILKNTICSGGDLTFTIITEPILGITNNYVYAKIVQGTPKSILFTALGSSFETFSIVNASIENSTSEVYVNDELWTKVTNIKEYGETDKVYEEINALDFSKVTIKFGNGINGKKLTTGDSILYKYIETDGKDGNILSQRIIDTVESTIRDSESNIIELFCFNIQQTDDTTDPYTIIDTGKIDGGKDYEDKESIRTNSSLTYQTSDVASGIEKWKTILLQRPEIYRVTVWGEYEVYQDNINTPGYEHYISPEENLVHISAYTQSGDSLSINIQKDIRKFLNDYKAPTNIPTFDDPEFVYFYFVINAIAIDRSVDLTAMNTAIRTVVEEKWGILNSDFFLDLDESTFKEVIREVTINDKEIVKKHNTEVILYNKYIMTSDILNITLSIYPIESESIEVYAKLKVAEDISSNWVKIATINAVGTFVSEPTYSVTGSINYNTGVGSLTYFTGLSNPITDYMIKIEYKIISPDIEVNKRNQVILLEPNKSIIKSIY